MKKIDENTVFEEMSYLDRGCAGLELLRDICKLLGVMLEVDLEMLRKEQRADINTIHQDLIDGA